MKLTKYILVIAVTAVICFFGMRWHYIGKITARAKPQDITSNSFYRMKHDMFTNAKTNEGCVIFLGDSLTDFLNLNELLPGINAINRGIAGDTTRGVLHRLDEVIRHKPEKLFLLIGTNDIAIGVSPEKIASNIREIITRIKEGTPGTKIYLQTLLPTNSSLHRDRPNDKINAVNEMLKPIAVETGCELVDLHALLSENGELPGRYTFDGLHINGEASQKWIDFIKPLL